VSVSIGVSTATAEVRTPADLVEAADARMYAAKARAAAQAAAELEGALPR
jgi:PleD family two-component response regulator